jgi:DNA-binding MarR family transcriptional regulator
MSTPIRNPLQVTDEAREQFIINYLRTNKANAAKLFQSIDLSDYALMWLLIRHEGQREPGKIYLVDLAETLHLPISTVSKMATDLKNKGLVRWQHDGNGEGGTYLQLTTDTRQTTQDQTALLRQVYAAMIAQFGEERFLALLNELAAFGETITNAIDGVDVPERRAICES